MWADARAVVAVALALLTAPAPGAAAAAPVLRHGDSGPAVRALQERLVGLRYLPAPEVDGRFGARTWHAVVAFQGWNQIVRDGAVGPATRVRLRRPRPLRPWSRRHGLEVHLSEQVLLLVRDRSVRRAVHVSSGAGGRTPSGRFRVIRRERMSWSTSFRVWMPYAQYFVGGYALHASPSVPAWPASHGCVRLTAADARYAWGFGALGMRVWVGAAAPPAAPARAVDAGCKLATRRS